MKDQIDYNGINITWLQLLSYWLHMLYFSN